MITLRQRRALELFFKIISEQFQNAGIPFHLTILGQEFEVPATRTIIRECLWKPIQLALFDITTTKDLDTQKIDIMIDVFTKHFGEKGYSIKFPSQQTLLDLIREEEIKNMI